MPCFTCAAGCRRFAMNFWESEAEDETKSICPGSKIHFVWHRGGAGAELRGHAVVELAHAAPVRAAPDQLLAGAGPAGAQPLSLWGVPRTLGRHALARAHDGAMGANDARGAREIPRRHARPLRPLRPSPGACRQS